MDRVGRKIGNGKSSQVFEYGEGKVLKLFSIKSDYNVIKWEYDKTIDAMNKGIPVPMVYGLIEHNKRNGIVMERIRGKSFWDIFIQHVAKTGGEENGRMSRLVVNNIKLIAQTLHSVHCIKAELMDTSHMVLVRAANYNKIITDNEREAVLKILDSLPNDGTVCHDGPNFDNIMIDNGKATYIDWYFMGSGYFMYDIAEFVITARYLYMSPILLLFKKRFVDYMEKYSEEIIKVFFEEYMRVSGLEIVELDKWLIPSLANRLNGGGSKKYKSRLLTDFRKKLALYM